MQSQTNSLPFRYSQGAHMQAEEIRCQFKAGQRANLQVSHYETWGHLKTLKIFSLPILFLIP